MNKIFETKPQSRKQNIVVQNFDSETLIYDLTANKAFCLNQTSGAVWQLCDGTKSIAEIADLMSENLKMPVSEDFVWLAIGDLQKENLIEVEISQPFFAGQSRREVIRKIGLASMIALPVISSLVAPRAVDAQSGCNCVNTVSQPGQPCGGYPPGFAGGLVGLAPDGACTTAPSSTMAAAQICCSGLAMFFFNAGFDDQCGCG